VLGDCRFKTTLTWFDKLILRLRFYSVSIRTVYRVGNNLTLFNEDQDLNSTENSIETKPSVIIVYTLVHHLIV